MRQSVHLGRLYIRPLYTTIRAFRKIIYQDIVYDNQCIQKDWRFVVLYGNQCIQEKLKIRGFHKAISAFRGKCRLGDSIRQPVHLEKIVDQVIPYGNQCIQEKNVDWAIPYGNQCIQEDCRSVVLCGNQYIQEDCRVGDYIRQSVHLPIGRLQIRQFYTTISALIMIVDQAIVHGNQCIY